MSKKSQYWTPEKEKLFVQYFSEGKTYEEISTLLGISNRHLAIQRYKIKSEIKKKLDAESNNYVNKFVKWTDDELELLNRLIKENKSIDDISKVMNMSNARIQSKCRILAKEAQGKKKERKKYPYIKKIAVKLDTKRWYEKDLKKCIYLYEQGKTNEDIAKEINRTVGAVKEKLTYYRTAFNAPRFHNEWTEEEMEELKSKDFNGAKFAKKWKRNYLQVADRRNRVKESLRTGGFVSRELSRVEKIICSLKLESNSKVYDTVPKKNYVQQTLYKSLFGINSPLLTLLGPTPERFLNMLTEYNIIGNNFIYSHEIDLDVFVKVAKTLTNRNINFTYGDIIAAHPQKLIDLDLMGRWETENELIKTMFNKQLSLSGDKYFMFTLSVRGVENINICEHIKTILYELLNIKYNITTEKTFIYDKLFVDKFNISENIQAYRYADTSPMISILIKQ
jgi:hypothetical protein